MLLDDESLFEVPHEMTTNVVHFGPLLEHEDYSQYNENSCQYAHPAHKTMRLLTAATDG